jgi:hypothetical protein
LQPFKVDFPNLKYANVCILWSIIQSVLHRNLSILEAVDFVERIQDVLDDVWYVIATFKPLFGTNKASSMQEASRTCKLSTKENEAYNRCDFKFLDALCPRPVHSC